MKFAEPFRVIAKVWKQWGFPNEYFKEYLCYGQDDLTMVVVGA